MHVLHLDAAPVVGTPRAASSLRDVGLGDREVRESGCQEIGRWGSGVRHTLGLRKLE